MDIKRTLEVLRHELPKKRAAYASWVKAHLVTKTEADAELKAWEELLHFIEKLDGGIAVVVFNPSGNMEVSVGSEDSGLEPGRNVGLSEEVGGEAPSGKAVED